MIYDYVNTKPPLEEVYLEHGWLKDQAAKVHKYIARWRGKNGKWYYKYKSKAQELGAKIDRNIKGIKADEISDNTYNDYTTGKRRIIGTTSRYVIGKDSGKAGSRSVGLSSNRPGFKGNITRVSSKISRKPKGNKSLKDRGFSTSKGSGESKRQSNLGTRKSVNNESNRTKQKQKAGVKGYTGNARKRGYSSSKTPPTGPRRIAYVQRDYDPFSKNGYRDSTTDDGYSRKAIENLTSEKEHSRALRNYYRIAGNSGTYIIKKGSNGTYTRRLRRQVRK